MRFAIMENVASEGGHEIDFDRILVEELSALSHDVEFYVPEGHKFRFDYKKKIHYLKGCGVSYDGAHGAKKAYLALKREYHRQKWYAAMYDYAKAGAFDALIFPSATYRYLRSLRISPLKKSPVPVLFLIHGLTPAEAKKLDDAAAPFATVENIRIGVQTFAKAKLKLTAQHTKIYPPPNYIPRDIPADKQSATAHDTLRLGIFGQYRREKNVDSFIRAFLRGQYNRAVQLVVQGATTNKADAQDFEDLIGRYANENRLLFWHKPLIGAEWQRGLLSVDAVVIPYGNSRYLYHTSAIIGNAMGHRRPIIVADNVNPEILHDYKIGISFKSGDLESLTTAITKFVNGYDADQEIYRQELSRAYRDFSPTLLAQNIISLAEGCYA